MPARKQTRAFTARAVARVALCALVVVASGATPLVAQDDADASDAPPGPARVLVRKRIVEDLIVEGSNVTVAVTLTNAGETEARKVKARDDGFANEDDFELITGKESLSATYATIAPGESVEYSFVVVPKKSGSFPGGAVSVSYLGTSGRETTHGSSNVLGATPVYTTMQKNIFAALKVGKYLTLGACRTIEDWVKYGTIIGSVCGALLLNWVALKVKKGVAAARRKMAVASLERSDRREKSA
jgi:translocon-associated protein subunit beta